MKKLVKLLINALAVLMLFVTTIGMTACADIKTLEVVVQVYDYDEREFLNEEDVTFNLDLYRHLAPQTVDAIIAHVQNGYYDNTFFYVEEASGYNVLLVGDLKYDSEGNVVQNLIDGKQPSQIYGEFEANGVKGSDLRAEKGTVGLYRTYFKNDGNFDASSTARDSGRATWMLPQVSSTAYNGYYCMFGKYDLDGNALTAIDAVTNVLRNTGSYTSYIIYYTGEYDASKPDENFGLTFHCVPELTFNNLTDEEKEEVFYAEGEQYEFYTKRRIHIPKILDPDTINASTASIKSVKVK